MRTYIEELAKGFIVPSKSPASAGFFFVKKREGTLRPCIDYRGLNDITIKFQCPLPLVPSALEQLRSAKYFTKLDLRNSCNLIRIREGDEWKTASPPHLGTTSTGLCHSGLSTVPQSFQAFINDVFRDMLNRWVIVSMDDILLYSDSLETHFSHVRAVLQRLISTSYMLKQRNARFTRLLPCSWDM